GRIGVGRARAVGGGEGRVRQHRLGVRRAPDPAEPRALDEVRVAGVELVRLHREAVHRIGDGGEAEGGDERADEDARAAHVSLLSQTADSRIMAGPIPAQTPRRITAAGDVGPAGKTDDLDKHGGAATPKPWRTERGPATTRSSENQ